MSRRAGARRDRVTVQARTTTTNDRGERSDAWANVYTDVPVSVRWLTTREMQAAAARQSEVTVEFETDAAFAITAEHRILWEGAAYELEAPTFDPKRRYLRIKAKEGVTDG